MIAGAAGLRRLAALGALAVLVLPHVMASRAGRRGPQAGRERRPRRSTAPTRQRLRSGAAVAEFDRPAEAFSRGSSATDPATPHCLCQLEIRTPRLDPTGQPTPLPANVPVAADTADVPGSSPATVPAEPASLAPPPRLARYIRDYEGGDCFFLNPPSLGPTRATHRGFGTSPTPFAAFDEAFKKRNGFEAQISVRLVTEAQCPAVAFMKEIGIDPDSCPETADRRLQHARAPIR